MYIFCYNPYNLLALVKQIFTQAFHLFFSFFIVEQTVTFVARITIVYRARNATEKQIQHDVDKQTSRGRQKIPFLWEE